MDKSNEIDVAELLRIIWSNRWFILKFVVFFQIVGIVIAFTTPTEYTSSSTLIPEMMQEEGSIPGSLGGLASLAGVDLGTFSEKSQTINPALYQSVSKSTPFLLSLMKQDFFFSSLGKDLSLYDFYLEHKDVGLLSRLLSLPSLIVPRIRRKSEMVSEIASSGQILSLSKADQDLLKDLRQRISVEMDWDLNLVNVQVEMQDPVAAAEIVQYTQDYITQYVTDYSIAKSRQQLASIENQYQERRKEFEQSQSRLAFFRDKNQNVNTAKAKSEEEHLLSEYNLALGIYTQLAQQREAVKLQIQESTPVFTVLEPAKIPTSKSSPRRVLILITSSLLGLILSFSYINIKVLFTR